MHPSEYRGADMYPNPVRTGRPRPGGPRGKVWPQLLAFLVVSALAIGGVVVGYRYIKEDAARAPEPIAPVLAPSEAECVQIRDLFAAWLDSDPPITIELTGRLSVETIGAVLAGGQQFTAGMDTLPAELAPNLRDAVQRYNEAVEALSKELSDGPANTSHVETVSSLATLIHAQYTSFSRKHCG
ncbi:hypothetical protein GCM10022251_41390 [Phytohabitans flavus]|uniref:Uncharacterized protein n=1 Tax=Phytohabitans flavus TaxID=1076124 RepID=A0A6F8Y0Q5_9ACTN|nr:hypothetical protein Pflav_060290 [Phytohabitans flavus]